MIATIAVHKYENDISKNNVTTNILQSRIMGFFPLQIIT